ncbi:MAG: TetR/AcrR family transcriptional regulator [Micrococcales bacterium]
MVTRRPRGPYAKGTAKREEILDRAVEAFGKTGYHATSMREIAAACNLSQAGLLHHFPNKESLLLAIVDMRETRQFDSRPLEQLPPKDSKERYLRQVEVNQEQEALTRLWANLVGEATDPAHPTHEYFKNRYRLSRKNFENVLAQMNGRTSPNKEDKLKAQLFIAMWDGLQNQWLLDDDFDMKPAFKYALEMFSQYSDKSQKQTSEK